VVPASRQLPAVFTESHFNPAFIQMDASMKTYFSSFKVKITDTYVRLAKKRTPFRSALPSPGGAKMHLLPGARSSAS